MYSLDFYLHSSVTAVSEIQKGSEVFSVNDTSENYLPKDELFPEDDEPEGEEPVRQDPVHDELFDESNEADAGKMYLRNAELYRVLQRKGSSSD
jgi:hypothetical protein